MSSEQDVTYTVKGEVGIIKFNRPKTYNALRHKTFEDLTSALRQAARDENTVVTIITGEGKFFSSGADFREVTQQQQTTYDSDNAFRKSMRQNLDVGPVEATRLLIDHPKIVIIALNGPVVGWPAGFISHGDIILASQSATLHAVFSQLGLAPEAGSSFGFVQRMGMAHACEALITSKKFDAAELHRIGFVNHVFPDATFESKVHEYVTNILESNIANSMLEAKRLLRQESRGVARQLASDEETALIERFVSGDPIRAFMQLAAKAAAKKQQSKL